MIREFLQDSPLLGRYLSHQPSGEWPSYEVQAPVALLTYGNIMLNVDFDILFHIVRINLLQSTIRGHREAQRCVCLYHFIFVVFLQPDVKPHFLWHLWIIQQTLEHLIQKDYIFLSDSTSDLLLMLFFIVYPVYPMFFLGSSNIYILLLLLFSHMLPGVFLARSLPMVALIPWNPAAHWRRSDDFLQKLVEKMGSIGAAQENDD